MNTPETKERLGVYVVSSNLKKSEAFYEAIFQRSAQIKMESFVGFDIAGGLFAVIDKSTFAPDSTVGDNAVPYIEVSNVLEVFDHILTVAPDAVKDNTVIEEGPITLFKFRDPDGNMVEYYSLSFK